VSKVEGSLLVCTLWRSTSPPRLHQHTSCRSAQVHAVPRARGVCEAQGPHSSITAETSRWSELTRNERETPSTFLASAHPPSSPHPACRRCRKYSCQVSRSARRRPGRPGLGGLRAGGCACPRASWPPRPASAPAPARSPPAPAAPALGVAAADVVQPAGGGGAGGGARRARVGARYCHTRNRRRRRRRGDASDKAARRGEAGGRVCAGLPLPGPGGGGPPGGRGRGR
jgi:hypothetical protein